jgi:hypothetical protein
MSSLDRKGFGENVRMLRKKRGLDVMGFRAKSLMPVTRLVEIERARSDAVTLPEMVTIAKTLDISTVELIEPFEPCCGDFEACKKACVKRADHWKTQFIKLKGVAK